MGLAYILFPGNLGNLVLIIMGSFQLFPRHVEAPLQLPAVLENTFLVGKAPWLSAGLGNYKKTLQVKSTR